MFQIVCSFWSRNQKTPLLPGESPHSVHVSSFTPMQKSVCTCAWVCMGEAICTLLAELEMMTESERQVSLGLKFKAPAVLSCIFPLGTGVRNLWDQF